MARKKSRSAPSRKPAARASAKKAAKAGSRKLTAKPAARASARKAAKPAAAAKRSSALDAKARAIANLKFAKKMTDEVVKAFPADRYTHQHGPTDNHVIWTLGHLAATYQWFLSLLDPKPGSMPESYNTMFGYSSKPVADPAAYPPFDEVRGYWEANYDRFVKLAEGHSDKTIMAPLAGSGGGFANDRLETIEKAAWHEGWHAGQLSSLRRALGLPSAAG